MGWAAIPVNYPAVSPPYYFSLQALRVSGTLVIHLVIFANPAAPELLWAQVGDEATLT